MSTNGLPPTVTSAAARNLAHALTFLRAAALCATEAKLPPNVLAALERAVESSKAAQELLT